MKTDRMGVWIADLLVAAGTPATHASVVSNHLVEAERCGLRSHGVVRVPQYVAEIERGDIDPAAHPTIAQQERGRILLDGNRSFGQLAGVTTADVVAEVADRHGLGIATVRQCGHAGRIGAYTESLADRGMVAIGFCSGPRLGHRVAPYGGREARFATNPISYAFPTEEASVVADFATSAMTEGHARILALLGEDAPAGALQTFEGDSTDDPRLLYETPPATLLPLGGRVGGHKGSALALLVEVMATAFGLESSADHDRVGNNLTLMAMSAPIGFRTAAQQTVDYVRSTPPSDPASAVLLPGDPEAVRRQANLLSVTIDRGVLIALCEVGRRYGVDLKTP